MRIEEIEQLSDDLNCTYQIAHTMVTYLSMMMAELYVKRIVSRSDLNIFILEHFAVSSAEDAIRVVDCWLAWVMNSE